MASSLLIFYFYIVDSLSVSVSLRKECKSKLSRVCHGSAVESSEVSAEML